MARKKKPEEHANHERWLVSYADFITLLFAFFTTLYAISTVDRMKAGKLVYSMRTAFNVEMFTTPSEQLAYQGVAQTEPMMMGPPGIGSEGGNAKDETGDDPESADAAGKKLAQDIQAIIDSLELGKHVNVKVEQRGIVVSLAEAGFFSSGSATIDDKGLDLLNMIAGRLSGEPYPVAVEGHTDNQPVRGGSFRSNWELSTARATHVIAHMIERNQFDASRLSASGYGEHRAIGDNSTEEGRAKNRRVDLVVQYRSPVPGGQQPAKPSATQQQPGAQPPTPDGMPAATKAAETDAGTAAAEAATATGTAAAEVGPAPPANDAGPGSHDSNR
ncbi:MAG: flagellar motor protein MotB [Pseudomonadota bacterium]